jgi:hypothetical protein
MHCSTQFCSLWLQSAEKHSKSLQISSYVLTIGTMQQDKDTDEWQINIELSHTSYLVLLFQKYYLQHLCMNSKDRASIDSIHVWIKFTMRLEEVRFKNIETQRQGWTLTRITGTTSLWLFNRIEGSDGSVPGHERMTMGFPFTNLNKNENQSEQLIFKTFGTKNKTLLLNT